MKKKSVFVILVVVLLSFGVTMAIGFAEDKKESQKVKDIREFMSITGSDEIGVDVINSLISNFARMMPQVPQSFWDEFRKQINPNEMAEKIIPVYEKHFTHEDIKGLLKFYNSDIGKKLISKQGPITEESMKIGEEWGYEQGMKAIDALKKKGLYPERPAAQP